MFETIIISNHIITGDKVVKGCVAIENGKIAAILESLPDGITGTVIDAGESVLMAGVIDPHVHINEPGRTDWEGFDTATKAAIVGGITTLVDMPLNASPVTTTVNNFKEKINATAGKTHTNVGFWAGLVPGNTDDIEGLIAAGVLGFKAFLTHSGIDEFPNVTEDDLRKAMPIIAKHNLPLLVHCELSDDRQRTTGDPKSYQNYLASRPKEWEDKAIAMIIKLCEEFNCRTHIVHLSSANSITQITAAKQKGLPISVETGQHYLYFNAEAIPDGKTEFKCAPPIREKANNEQLWQALKDGIIDFVATDHSPAPPDLKQMETGDFMKAWGGISSIQFALPVLWTAAQKHGCTIKDMAKWLSENPAKLIGKENAKGQIAVGFDADLIIWDPNKTFKITSDIILHKHKITPYLNEQLNGVVNHVFLKGKQIVKEGKIIKLNSGELIMG